MKSFMPRQIGSVAWILFSAILGGALSGAISGWTVARMSVAGSVQPVLVVQNASSSSASASSTMYTKEPDITVVNVDRSPLEPIVPPVFTDRRTSPVATVYRKPTKGVVALKEEDALAQAVALTSDGWFVIPLEVMKDQTLADVVLWHEGSLLHVVRGIADNRGSVAFLKVETQNLVSPAFARFQDIGRGTVVWTERRSGGFESMSVTALGKSPEDLRGVSSDLSARRGELSDVLRAGDLGAPVWGTNGSLIGLMIGVVGERARFIPSSAFAPSLYGIFADGAIKHATLGVLSVDLSEARVANASENLPRRGAWVSPDASKNLPAILTDSPAMNAGLKEGDVIQRVDRDILDGRADLGEVLVQYKPNSSVTLTVLRGSETLEIPVTLGSKVVSSILK